VQQLEKVKSPYPLTFKIKRALWSLVRLLLFRPSPPSFFFWRNWILRLFGARLGRRTQIYNSAKIFWPGNLSLGDHSAIGPHAELYCLGKITIADNVVVSQHAYLCAGTHDISSERFELLMPPIIIESGAWIAAKAFIGPGVRIGKNAIVGAAAVAVKDVAESSIVAGNPARVIGVRTFRPGSHQEIIDAPLGEQSDTEVQKPSAG
jgi:putative colanic acid biosynthesis acetyltransferase WcaF